MNSKTQRKLAKSTEHVSEALIAAQDLVDWFASTDPKDWDAEVIFAQAKKLEAAGCHARRTLSAIQAEGLIEDNQPASASQRVVVVGPNLRDQTQGEFHVHAEGCADLKRDPNLKHEDQSWVIEVSSLEEVAAETYADIIAESEGTTAADYLTEFHFAPCVTVR
jgi:hypothetical protein